MKKTLFLLAALAVFFVACDNDDKEENTDYLLIPPVGCSYESEVMHLTFASPDSIIYVVKAHYNDTTYVGALPYTFDKGKITIGSSDDRILSINGYFVSHDKIEVSFNFKPNPLLQALGSNTFRLEANNPLLHNTFSCYGTTVTFETNNSLSYSMSDYPKVKDTVLFSFENGVFAVDSLMQGYKDGDNRPRVRSFYGILDGDKGFYGYFKIAPNDTTITTTQIAVRNAYFAKTIK